MTDDAVTLADLWVRLREAEDTLRAIRRGEVDALLIDGPGGLRTYTLAGADRTYRVMFEHMQEGAVTADDAGVILYANPSFCKMAGLQLNALIGRSVAAFVNPEEATRLLEQLARARNQATATGEFNLRSHGQARPVQISAVSYQLDDVETFCLIVSDMTLARMQRELEDTNRQLEECVLERTAEAERRARQLQVLAGELGRIEQKERRRIAQLLHDGLQQLLVAAKMRISVLAAARTDAAGADGLNAVLELVNECIRASRSLTVELIPPVVYERGLVAAMDWLSRHFEQEHKLAVAVLADGAPEISNENLRVFLFHAVREALFNTVKYANANEARVEIEVPREGWVRLVISDDGEGCDISHSIPGSTLHHGFGLFSIQQRLDLYGGKLKTFSAPGKGFTTILEMPIEEPETAPPAVLAAPEPKEEPVQPPPRLDGATRVLLVDDHKLMRAGLANLLLNQPDIEVVGEAGDGLDALRMARQLSPDVVVMDISMPRMNGIEATMRIKRELPGVRIIALSMHESADVGEAILDAGAEQFLSKDCASHLLVAAVHG